MTKKQESVYEGLISSGQKLISEVSRKEDPGHFEGFVERNYELSTKFILHYDEFSYARKKDIALFLETIRYNLSDKRDVFRVRALRDQLKVLAKTRIGGEKR